MRFCSGFHQLHPDEEASIPPTKKKNVAVMKYMMAIRL
jgi:hypothetical protein